MYGRKIKYYRIKSGLTIDTLASKLSLTKAAISQYENDKRDPDEATLKSMGDVFNIPWINLLPQTNGSFKFNHCSFRKKLSASQNDVELLKVDIEKQCENQIELMEILGSVPKKGFNAKKLSDRVDAEENAQLIRKALEVSPKGPIYSVTNKLEKLGIIVMTFDCSDKIEGINGTVNNIPYIFFNSHRTIERQRFTLIHEFCHLFFNHLEKDGNDFERYINKVAGRVLMPDEDLIEEFGLSNRNLNVLLRNSVAKEYKIAPSCLINRLYEAGIISKTYYQNFFKFLNARVGKKNEESLLDESYDSEEPTEFKQHIYRALGEELITKSKAADLLGIDLFALLNKLKEA